MTGFIATDASQVYKLATDLFEVPAKAIPPLREAMAGVGSAFAEEWKRNARETSGQHGKWYPDSIDSELAFSVTSVAVEAGPNVQKKQGRMGPGFEFGSKNQPPHLDGLRALDGLQTRAERIVSAAAGLAFR